MQLDAPATVGMNVPKVSAAEVFGYAGVKDIFVSNEIIGLSKVERLINLSKIVKVSTSVDSLVGARGLDAGAKRQGVELEVLIHVDSGNRRTGTLPGEPTLELARKVAQLDNLNLKGVWTHEGHNYTGRTPEEVLRITEEAGEKMVETKRLIEDELGREVYNSVGSTPGAKLLAKMDGVDEVRPGAYVFYDESQVVMGSCERKDCALTILSTVFSRPAADRAVCDAGSKSYYPPGDFLAFTDEGLQVNWPLPVSAGGVVRKVNGEVYEDLVFHRWGEEYGIMKLYDSSIDLKIGDLVEIIPYHICTTVNLHDELVMVRNGEVEAVWPISARGKYK
jgi:D-serine deaminase-like pyridoxal phosphate-dependent protein